MCLPCCVICRLAGAIAARPGFAKAMANLGAAYRAQGNVDEALRMSLVGGELHLASRPGHGTRITARVPLDRQPMHPLIAVAWPPDGQDRPGAPVAVADDLLEAKP